MNKEINESQPDSEILRERITRIFAPWVERGEILWHYGYCDSDLDTITNSVESRAAKNRMAQEVFKLLDLSAGQTVVDLGCGVGSSSELLAELHQELGLKIIGITIGEDQAQSAKTMSEKQEINSQNTNTVDYLVADYHRIPFPDNSIDRIFAMESICHSPNIGAAMQEIARVLKPNGLIVIADAAVCEKSGEQAFTKEDEDKLNIVDRGFHTPTLLIYPAWHTTELPPSLEIVKDYNITPKVLSSLLHSAQVAESLIESGQKFPEEQRASLEAVIGLYQSINEGLLLYHLLVLKKKDTIS